MKINLIYKVSDGVLLVSSVPGHLCCRSTSRASPRLSLGTNRECDFYESLLRGRAHF